MTERKRTDLYYFDQLDDKAALMPDGSVVELEEKTENIQVERPSRREDRRRVVNTTRKVLAQKAVYESLQDYVDYRKNSYMYRDGFDHSWSMDDMPDDVMTDFANWRDGLSLPSDDNMVETAQTLIATESELENTTVKCTICKNNDTYKCYSCGYSRKLYKYPLIRLEHNEENIDVPLDIARLVTLNPGAITFDNNTRFDREGRMGVQVEAVVHTDCIPLGYAGIEESGYFSVGKSDRLSDDIRLPIAKWSENEAHQMFRIDKLYSASPDKLLPQLQQKAISITQERVDIEEYQKMYDAFIEKTRKIGRAVMMRRRSHFGDTDIELSVSISRNRLFDFVTAAQGSSTIEGTLENILESMKNV